jgi:hypothetical protein
MAIACFVVLGMMLVVIPVMPAAAPAIKTEPDDTPKTAVDQTPIVIVPGWHGRGEGLIELWNKLDAEGYNVVDFSTVPGDLDSDGHNECADADGARSKVLCWSTRPQSYGGESYDGVKDGDGIVKCAEGVLAQINYKLGSSADFHLITHSMGGHISRVLLDDIGPDCHNRIQKLINLQAAHWGAPIGNWLDGTILQGLLASDSDPWVASAYDVKVDSALQQALDGDSDDVFETSDVYTQPEQGWYCIAGDPAGAGSIWSIFNIPGHDMNNMVVDGYNPTGFDGLVPSDGAWLSGATNYWTPTGHWEAGTGTTIVQKVFEILGNSISYSGPNLKLTGDVQIKITGHRHSHDDIDVWPSDDHLEPIYKVWVDLDGDQYADSWISAGTINAHEGTDVPPDTTKRWLPSSWASNVISLGAYDTPFVNVKVEVWDYDPWPDTDDYIATYIYKAISIASDDEDGGEYHLVTDSTYDN